jgi:CBS domain-containing protein/RimJ/RimL family protein N-acetyltransferase
MSYPLEGCTLHRSPHAFISKRGEAILIRLFDERLNAQLLKMYLDYTPRNSFDGLPPLDDAACANWVQGMIRKGINLVALSFDQGVVGHVGLSPMGGQACEILVVVVPAFQNAGIGSRLVYCAVQVARELRLDRIWLSVDSTNLRARHVYKKCGFACLRGQRAGHTEMELDRKRHERLTRAHVGLVMQRSVHTIAMDLRCKVAVRVLVRERIGALPVINDQREVIGIVSETDLLQPLNFNKLVSEVMTRQVTTVSEQTPIERVIELFHNRKLRCIPVVGADGKLAGVVGRKDILTYYSQTIAEEPSGTAAHSAAAR